MYSIKIFFIGNMNNKPQKLELTWIGKDEQASLEPRGKSREVQAWQVEG